MAHNVIVKQLYDCFGMKKQSNRIYLGDIRKEFAQGFLVSMEKLIDKHQDRESFHILVHSRFDIVGKRTVKTVIMVMPGDAIPPKVIGTMCFHIDNKKGILTKRWIVPLDKPYIKGMFDNDPVEGLIEDAKGLPIKGIVFTQ